VLRAGRIATPAFSMSDYFPARDDCSTHAIFPGVTIRTCSAERMMLSVVDLAAYAVVEEHSHPHEQVGMILEGRARFIIGGEEKVLDKGDLYRIPGHVKHRVIALDGPVKALDVFTPVREDYR
jgi:quercetin dioxygenase-like cupin family protein